MITAARRAVICTLLVAWAGCVSEPPPFGSVELTMGTVDAAGAGFFPLEGDQPLKPGSQGGLHVSVKYRVRGMPEGPVKLQRTARRVADDRLVQRTDDVAMLGAPDERGMWELPDPLRAFICPPPIGVVVVGQKLRFKLTMMDMETDEVIAEATAEATPHCPPEGDPKRATCLKICAP